MVRDPRDWFRGLDGEWRAVVIGALSAPVLVVVGLLVGLVEGGLLPWDCQGLACVYLAVVLAYSGGLLVAWGIVSVVVVLTRRRWPTSPVRRRVLQLLAVLSYGPAVWFVVTAIGAGL